MKEKHLKNISPISTYQLISTLLNRSYPLDPLFEECDCYSELRFEY